VIAALLLTDRPLGFEALLGVLALTGMIARKFGDPHRPDREEKDKRVDVGPATASARSCRRLRPRSSVSSPLLRPSSGPDYAIVGGLAVATALTLFLPALYVAWFPIKRPQPEAAPKLDSGHFSDSGEDADHEAGPEARGGAQPRARE
jgi:hypothetical protein